LKICNLHIHAVPPETLNSVMEGLVMKLTEPPKIASHACSGIFNIAQSLRPPPGEDAPDTSLLSKPMLPMLQALLGATERPDSIESNLRVSAMSAVTELVNASARDCQPMLSELLPNIVDRIFRALQIQVVSNDDNENKEQLLGLLCALLQVLVQRLDKEQIMPHVDRAMDYLLQVCQVRNSSCFEEALLAVGAVAGALEEDFVVRTVGFQFESLRFAFVSFPSCFNTYRHSRYSLLSATFYDRNTSRLSCRCSSKACGASRPSRSASFLLGSWSISARPSGARSSPTAIRSWAPCGKRSRTAP